MIPGQSLTHCAHSIIGIFRIISFLEESSEIVGNLISFAQFSALKCTFTTACHVSSAQRWIITTSPSFRIASLAARILEVTAASPGLLILFLFQWSMRIIILLGKSQLTRDRCYSLANHFAQYLLKPVALQTILPCFAWHGGSVLKKDSGEQ